MISTCCELHTTHEATYSTIMKPLCINIVHFHKTRKNSQGLYWLCTKIKYTLTRTTVLWGQCPRCICTIPEDIAMIRLPCAMLLSLFINPTELIHVSSIISSKALSYPQLLLRLSTQAYKKATELHCIFTRRSRVHTYYDTCMVLFTTIWLHT